MDGAGFIDPLLRTFGAATHSGIPSRSRFSQHSKRRKDFVHLVIAGHHRAAAGSRCHQTLRTTRYAALFQRPHPAPAHSPHTDSYKKMSNAVFRAHLFNYFDAGGKVIHFTEQ